MSQNNHEVPHDVLQQRLVEHFKNRTPCVVSCGDMKLVVYVTNIGVDIAIGRRVNTATRELSGWFAFRLAAIADLEVAADSADICASISALNNGMPPKLPFKADTMEQLAIRVCRFFPLVIVNGKSSGDGTDGIAGTIVDLDGDTIVLREMSTQFEWMPELLHIQLSHIKYFLFGSDYENDLTQFGDWNDRLEWMKRTLKSIKAANDQITKP